MYKPYVRSILFDNISYKLIALLISLVLWIFLMSRDDVVEEVSLALKVNVPADHSLIDIQPKSLNVVLKGNPKLVRRYLAQKKIIEFEILNTKNKNINIAIKKEKLDIPFGIDLVSYSPKELKIIIEEAVK